ncbi:MAG TPA: S53 family peptidase [Rhizomicrobium sp.]|jgi:subtilase family serine protease
MSSGSKLFLSTAVLTALAGISIGTSVQAAPAPQIVRTLDENSRVTLEGNTRPEANAQNDRGRVADSFALDHLQLVLRRPQEQERAVDAAIDQMHDRQSPSYHKWLTATEFGQRFGNAQADVDKVTAWLTAHGFHVNDVSAGRTIIDFSGTAGQVRAAFHTEIHNLDVNGVHHIANMADPQVPVALAPAIEGIASLHDFMPRPNYKVKTNYTLQRGATTDYAVLPADLATIYNFTPAFNAGITGLGETVVVIEDSDVTNVPDWTTFRQVTGLSNYTSGSFTQVHPGKNCSDPGATGDSGEASLDAQWSSAAAPNAAIVLASCSNTQTNFGGFIAFKSLIDSKTPPPIVSISYGECETEDTAAGNKYVSKLFQQAVAQGISVFTSSGDAGAASCDQNTRGATHGVGVSGLTTTPYNVSVGGTDFGDTYAGTNTTYWSGSNSSVYGSALSYVPEIPWNDSCASQLIASFNGATTTYGSDGFCNTTAGERDLTTAAGSGGPSGCATGKPAVAGVVGGSCKGWPKPSWQKGFVGIQNDKVRDVPDVSLFAANGVWDHFYLYCSRCSTNPALWSGAGGTSFASPIFAGIQALIDQKAGGTQGNPDPVLYSLAATEYGSAGSKSCNAVKGNKVGKSCIFYDVTEGDMDVNCTGTADCYLPSGTNGVLSTTDKKYKPAFGTATGWDFATGIGTVNVTNLVNAWPQ